MTGDSNYFRKRLFGGFNRTDVVNYVTALAKERNELEAAKDKAEKNARTLAEEVATLRRDSEEAWRTIREDIEQKYSVFEAAVNAFVEFEGVFSNLREEIEVAATDVFAELRNTVDITAKLPAALTQAYERFEELRASFEAKKSDPDTVDAISIDETGTDHVDTTDAEAVKAPESDVTDTPETGAAGTFA